MYLQGQASEAPEETQGLGISSETDVRFDLHHPALVPVRHEPQKMPADPSNSLHRVLDQERKLLSCWNFAVSFAVRRRVISALMLRV